MASNEWLVRKLHEQDKKIEALSRGGTGVGHTSIAPGENLTVISDNGEVVLGAGGVEHVDGPTPATPSAPTLKLGFGTIETTWDGTFAEGEDEDGVPLTAPVDFDVVEVHCSTDPEEEEWGEDTMRGQIKTREGGTITVGGFDVDDEVFVCLIALAKTGKRSAPSATASLVIEGLDFSQLFTEIDAANATIKNAGEVLVTEQDTLNDKLSDAFGQIDDIVANGSGTKNFYTPTMPAEGMREGDLWFDPSDSNKPYIFQDGEWVTVRDSFAQPGAAMEIVGAALPNAVNNQWSNVPGFSYTVLTLKAEVPAGAPSGGAKLVVPFQGTVNASGVPVIAGSTVPTQGLPIGVAGSLLVKSTGVAPTAKLHTRFQGGPWPDGLDHSFELLVEPYTIGGNTHRVKWDTAQDAILSGYGPLVESIGFALEVNISSTAGSHVSFNAGTPLTGRLQVPGPGLADGAITTEKIATGAITAESGIIGSLDLGTLTAGSAAIKEAVINKLFSDVVVAKMAVAEQFIGENAILTGAVTAPKITASEELWAKIGQFVKIRAEHIEADAIDGMVITGATIRSAATGARTLMSASGFEAFDNSGKRTFFASASTGNVSMTGELYTGESGSERVVLDNALWNSVEIEDPETGAPIHAPGAGVRIGVSSSSGADIYHATFTATDGRFVDGAVIRGPGGRARTTYAKVSAANGLPATNYVTSSVYDNSGVIASDVNATVGGHGVKTRKAELTGRDSNGRYRAGVGAYGTSSTAEIYGKDAAGVTRALVSASEYYRQAQMTMLDSAGGVSASVGAYGDSGFTVASGTNVRPFNVKYRGTGDSWLIPFAKEETDWGYVGSTGAMGVDEFGVQSASGKNLVLRGDGDLVLRGNRHSADYNSTTGTANVRLTTTGFLGVTSSSRRYKDAIEPATETVDELVNKLLSVDARTWFDKNSAERLAKALTEEHDGEEPDDDLKDVEPLRRIPGVIAEELHDVGLGILVEYNDDGLPESVMYDRLGAMLLPVVRDLRDRITELERQTHV